MTDAYYKQTPQQALETQKTSANGLSGQEAQARAQQFGPNQLAEGEKKGVLQVFAEQFKDLLVIILIIAALISAASGNLESTIVIIAVLILNAILGTVQYFKAEKSLESLKAMSSPTAKVLRDGKRMEIPSTQIVPGDIVLLEAGDMVVADGRILENYSLKVNESSLTGESEGVDKTADVIHADHVALGDQKNMVFSGSLVTYGRATLLVTASGQGYEVPMADIAQDKCRQCNKPNALISDVFAGRPVAEPPAPTDGRSGALRFLDGLSLEERMSFWKGQMERCIRCYACRSACPMCVCRDHCVSDSRDPEWLTQDDDVLQKMFFQLIHAQHLAGRCTGCGECQRACPMGIPVFALKQQFGRMIKNVFGYAAGMDPTATPPLLTYQVEEPNIKERELS